MDGVVLFYASYVASPGADGSQDRDSAGGQSGHKGGGRQQGHQGLGVPLAGTGHVRSCLPCSLPVESLFILEEGVQRIGEVALWGLGLHWLLRLSL